MEIKGIDISSWQGKIDWKKVSDYGMDFAIIRITEVGNVKDSQFENNSAGCNKHKIPVGVYKYSYAMTVAEIQSEARKVVSVLNGRKTLRQQEVPAKMGRQQKRTNVVDCHRTLGVWPGR